MKTAARLTAVRDDSFEGFLFSSTRIDHRQTNRGLEHSDFKTTGKRREADLPRRAACYGCRRIRAGASHLSGLERSEYRQEEKTRGQLARRAACYGCRRIRAGASH